MTGSTFRQGIEAINDVNFIPLEVLAEYDPDNLSATFLTAHFNLWMKNLLYGISSMSCLEHYMISLRC
jgi:hypothetical protein